MSAHQADLSGSIHATPRSTTSTAPSAAAAAAVVANLVTGGNGPAPIALDLRPASLHESALSPSEHAVFPIWLSNIKAAPSGQPGLYDEHDALNFLRRDCGIEAEEEIQILSLFERTPRGMTAGHVYALMRLASWVKAGQAPTRRLLFTQAPPLKLKKLPPQSPPKPIALKSDLAAPTRYPTAAPPQTPATASYPRSTTAFSSAPRESTGSVLNKPTPALPPSAMESSPAIPQSGPSAMSMHGSRAGTSTVHPASTPVLPPLTGVDALLGFDPAPNPFKQAAGSAQMKPPQQFQNPPAPVPAPPPRPQQPRIVKPTPVVASAAGASNPFRSASLSMPRAAPMYGVSVSGQSDHNSNESGQQGPGPFAQPGEYSYSAVAAVAAAAQAAAANRQDDLASPPLPPRPSFGGGEAAALGQLIQTAAPPPLPARVHPLIQAGLYASSEVRKRKEALPPKTFSVIQSSSSSKVQPTKSKPRLLTGEAAPLDMRPPPQHQASAKKRAAAAAAVGAAGGSTTPFSHRGTETRRSVSDVHAFLCRHSEQNSDGNALGGSDVSGPARASRMGGGGDDDHPVAGSSKHGADTVVPASTSGAKTTLLGNPATYAPKASYAHVSKSKGSLPAWLREQEELQRSALVHEDPDHPPTEPQSPFTPTSGSAHFNQRSHSSLHHPSLHQRTSSSGAASGSNGHLRRSANLSSGSAHAASRRSMISALDAAVLEDEDESDGRLRRRRGVTDEEEDVDDDDDDDDDDDQDFVDAPVASAAAVGSHRAKYRSGSGRGGSGGREGDGGMVEDDSRSEQEMSEQARSAATSIERPHNPFVERSAGATTKGLPGVPASAAAAAAMQALVSEPGGANLVRPLGRSKTLHNGKGPAPPLPPPPPMAPPRRRQDSSPATALESPSFTLSSGQAFRPPPQRSPTAEIRRGGSMRVASSASHSRHATDEGEDGGGALGRTGAGKRGNSFSWRQASGASSPTDLSTVAATAGSRANAVGASIKEKMTDLFRNSIAGVGGEGGALSREYSNSGGVTGVAGGGGGGAGERRTPGGANGHHAPPSGGNEAGSNGFPAFLTKPSPKGERPLDLLQQDIASVVERHGWLSRVAEKAKGRPVSEGRRGLMSGGGERESGHEDHDGGYRFDDDDDDGAGRRGVGEEEIQRRRRSRMSLDRPRPDDDDGVAPDTDHPSSSHASGGSATQRSGSYRRSAIEDPLPEEIGGEVGSPDQSPFGDSNRPTDGYARLS
ncbi:hypothetical protein V8E36_002880 [Tilletia maclaganii]